jgi:hypothetical protein
MDCFVAPAPLRKRFAFVAGNDDLFAAVAPAMTRRGLCAENEISPTTSTRFHLSSPLRKNFPLRASPKSKLYRTHPVPLEGRFAIVTDVGLGMRWTRPVPKDERRGSRTVKSCGSDVSTLASSFAEVSARRRRQESPIAGKSAK